MKNLIYKFAASLLLVVLTLYPMFASSEIAEGPYKISRGSLESDLSRNIISYDSIAIPGEYPLDNFGRTLADAGDFNGDGYDDFIIGAYSYNSNTGRVYLYLGGPIVDIVPDLIFTGEIPGDYFGSSISSAGDVNGDGYSDIIIGAYNYFNSYGRAYLYFGGSVINNIPDLTITGTGFMDNFASSVSSAGDLNNDGYDDVVISGFGPDSKVKVYFGGQNMNNIVDVVIYGENSSYFGACVSSANDLNGDGYSDIAVGSPLVDKCYIYLGSANMNNIADIVLSQSDIGMFGYSVSSAGDMNGDGYSDLVVGAYRASNNSDSGKAYVYLGGTSMDTVADFSFTGEAPLNYLGWCVSSARDINSDGFSDIIVGSFGYNNNIGRSYVFLGGDVLNNVPDLVLEGRTANSNFGVAVSYAGDLNNDGISEILVGAPDNSISGGPGYAYVYKNLFPRIELLQPANSSINNSISIDFKWKKFDGANRFIFQIARDSNFTNIEVVDSLLYDTIKSVNNLQKDSRYFWRVRSVDSVGRVAGSPTWSFKTQYSVKVDVKLIIEGLYYPLFGVMSRKDTIKAYLRNTTSPYSLVDSCTSTIDSVSFTFNAKFNNAVSGRYYIVINHFQSLETWSKSGGDSLTASSETPIYDFTNSASKAYGNNLKLKGGKYCIISGDVSQDGFIDGSDFLVIDNDAYNFASGRFLPSDLNGDGFTDALDMQIGDNNRNREVIRP